MRRFYYLLFNVQSCPKSPRKLRKVENDHAENGQHQSIENGEFGPIQNVTTVVNPQQVVPVRLIAIFIKANGVRICLRQGTLKGRGKAVFGGGQRRIVDDDP